ncbi:L-rhamnose mutarotase [Staphylococcus gallinarum]|uniref:L-rhamnose mutarotase n=1 Tax=Staphylococcus gallinarum TaxID=1293 RepID=A0A0D0RQS9_STAGA|nr:L-rhamnose mutarotase [Staphylococcus gallinarum]KIR12317.1 L-rhamnose mutarotase [Staphylococcus gallinarum]MEB7039074.1 L-rhamnose mutarotase [Staphylococcus gallinarum]RTX79333.1 L-rhamnose mutarotase [Staphylococcus gallinarum]SUM31639.1 L-rhamnose mutarotase [Staphylococcus gallinarum]GEQ04252.1 L-rhamnose mutarotase [Staphylococcus gallinarum]
MNKIANVMYVKKGCYEEYKKRHDLIWPEMKEMLKNHGVSNYHIYLNEKNGELFTVLDIENQSLYSEIANHKICQEWWDYMADIMYVNSDNSPKYQLLKEVFFLE